MARAKRAEAEALRKEIGLREQALKQQKLERDERAVDRERERLEEERGRSRERSKKKSKRDRNANAAAGATTSPVPMITLDDEDLESE